MDIGIDLGTTYSVIAVKGKVPLSASYPEGVYLEECDVTIIPTPVGDPTFPSVFWVNPDDPAEVLVGSDAKEKAKEGEAPIMFSKRSIGTREPLRLGERSYTAKAVATQVLRHLKQCAEQALGEPVRRAVVTHPAYFDPGQVQETREAALAAGFDMALPEQVMMEPAAAALAYTLGDERDPLRVMTYDLGGGTFDVTVLERREGVITIKGFDGDHLLGGYNFDRALVQWMLDRLKESGREIPYDETDPADRARRARLLQLAEKVKFDLAAARSDKVKVNIKGSDILVDAAGRPVQIILGITGQEYVGLIQDELDKTIRCCHQALAKAGMSAEELDQILLVGGSTYAPWVKRVVENAFGTAVEPFSPDLCVAAGAALRAAELPAEAISGGIKLTVEAPSSCALPRCNVSGSVSRDSGSDLSAAERDELKVELRTASGVTLGPIALQDNGSFLFEDVELNEGEANPLEIKVTGANGLVRLSQGVEVWHSFEGGTVTEIHNVLPKPIYLKTGTGFKVVAEEGVPLPAKCEIKTVRAHADSTVVVDVYQSDAKIGEVRVENIPEDAGEGCPVIINVEITVKNEMRGEAQVLTRNGSVAARRPVHVDFPPIPVPDVSQLRQEFDNFKSQRDQLEVLSEDPAQRLELAGKGKKLVRKIEKLLGEQEPDRQELQREIQELRKLIEPPKDDMDPPRAHYRQLLETCNDELAAAGSDPQIQALRPLLATIEKEANDAYTTKNQRKWSQANDKLMKLYERIRRATGGGEEGGGKQELPPTPLLKDHFRDDIDRLRRALEDRCEELGHLPDYESRLKPRLNMIASQLDQVERAINNIDDNMKPEQAKGQIQLAMRPVAKLQEDLRNVDVDVR